MTIPVLRRILVVEDDKDVRTIARRALTLTEGLTVDLCASGREALERAPGLLPDLILLDVMMPGMDGPSTLRALRERPETRDIPVVLLTAKVLPDEVDQYRSLGVLGVIKKPFEVLALPDLIRAMWERHHGAQEGPSE